VSSSGSISFDRAAPYYDRTRALSDSSLGRLIPMLAAELSGSDRVLEIGIGTGRIALPLMREGVRITGVDISRDMLARLRLNADGETPQIAIADATRLPFPDRTFGAAVAAHVLHLIPAWKDAVAELLRVTEPGGVLVASRGSRTSGGEWWHAVRREFFRAAGSPPWPPGMDRIEELDEEMRGRGAAVKKLPEISQAQSATVNDLLLLLEEGVWSACWSLDVETRRRAAAVARDWGAANLGDLHDPRPVTEVLAWRAYVLPARD
jgi:ubiquinone/menaquinone biosynthesis C-methylase UbiE